jgi:hypothetical protein
MAVRIPLTGEDLDSGFDTVLVLGVRTVESAPGQAAELARLLDAHRYSRGLAFVPQGARTNNTAARPSDHPPPDPAGVASFEIARGGSLVTRDGSGRRFADALGINPETFAHVSGADRDEQAPSRAMVSALWPATIGYFLEQFLAPDVDGVDPQALRRWTEGWVRPRGPLPAFRVGAVPYGVLPAVTLHDWAESADEDVPPGLAEALRRLTARWAPLTRDAPHVGRSGDGDRDLVEVLGMDASTQTARVRRAIGYDAMWNVMTASGLDLTAWQRAQKDMARAVLAAIGERDWDPRVLYLSYRSAARDFTGPLVAGTVSEDEGLPFDYVAWLRDAEVTALQDQNATPTDEPVTALLYLMLRQALLTESDRAGRLVLGSQGLLLPFEWREPELLGILPGVGPDPSQAAPDRTAWDRFGMPVPGVPGAPAIGDVLSGGDVPSPSGIPGLRAAVAIMAAYRDALGRLTGLPTAELERLVTETLDVCSHRLDAWVTSLATRRLDALRRPAPRGLWLGCYGWVEDLRPGPPARTVRVSRADGTTVPARVDSGGYVHAPSMLHGATAAVLRSAYLQRDTGAGPGREPYQLDLSSARVRTALALLDGVRGRQPLGAVLGYQFEQGLHDGHPGLELDRFLDVFRALYPLVANKAEDSGEPAARVGARNVVDGLRLLAAWQAGTVPWGNGELTPAAVQRTAIEAELAGLDDAVDAVADLLLGESVFQVVKGSPAGAAATLDTLAKGMRPPEPELVTAPRTGTVLHQRVALLLGDGLPAPGWDQVRGTPRAAAAPELDAWLGRLLGDPALIACRATPEGGTAWVVTLRDLDLAPIDLLLTLSASGPGHGGRNEELDRRIGWQVAGETGADTPLSIDYEAADGPGRIPFAAAFELLAAVAGVIGAARPLGPADLIPPEQAATAAGGDAMDDELDARAAAAGEALDAVLDALARAVDDGDAEAARAGLATAADLGVAGAFPASRFLLDDAAEPALLAAARGVVNELARRQTAAASAAEPDDVLHAVFGRGFPVVPRFRPAAPDEIAPAVAAEPGLGPDPDGTAEGWLAQLMRVRPPLSAWRSVQVYGRALGCGLDRPRIVQLPYEPGADWAALPFGAEAAPPRPGTVSLALLGGPAPAADAAWAGLLLDTWPELVPGREEDVGAVFHFDAPASKAPQAVLIATPPSRDVTWSYAALERILLDTFDLARIRTLDLTTLGPYGQLIPMTLVASNTRNQTVSTSFDGLLAGEPRVIPMDGGS